MNKVVIAIIENDNKILLSRVKPDKLKEFGGLEYVFPGGRVKDQESLIDALIREIQEETGLDVEVVGQVSYRIHPTTLEEIYYYHCICIDSGIQNIPLNQDIRSLHWVSVIEVEDFINDINPDIKRYLNVL